VTNKYLQAGEGRAERVENLFSKIARRYDLLNDVMSFGMHRAWKRQLVRRSGFDGKKRALDLCCGTGDIAFLLAARAMRLAGRTGAWGNESMQEEYGNIEQRTSNMERPTQPRRATANASLAKAQAGTALPLPTSQAGRPRYQLPPASIVGLDFTEPMLRLANERARLLQQHGHEAGLAFVRGDAMRLPFADGSFDVVTVGYGLRNIADMRQALREVHRVLKPGGIFLSLDMGKPKNVLWRKLFFTHLRLTLPVLGWLFLRDADAYRYLVDSLEIYPAQEGVKQAMEEIGFVEVGIKNFCGGAMGLVQGKK
jgi:ubiquinone/menaquinone biosynthesis methyltransferase